MQERNLDDWISCIRNYKQKSGPVIVEIYVNEEHDFEVVRVSAYNTKDVVWLDTILEQISIKDAIEEDCDLEFKKGRTYEVLVVCWIQELELADGVDVDGGIVVEAVDELLDEAE
jgi:hypothetical protein